MSLGDRGTRGGHLVPVIVSNPNGNPAIIDFPIAGKDAFARQRVSEPYTVFDSKQLFDSDPLYWDDAQTSGGGTGTSHSTNRASTTISVGNTTAGTRVRQTKQYFNYQPGKGQLIMLTGVLGAGASGITKRVGYFDANNGLYFQLDDNTLSIARRSNVSGSPVNYVTPQSDWNLDKVDGTGPSGMTFDTTKAQIFFIQFEWLSVGSIWYGVFHQGRPVYVHRMDNANSLNSAYMSTPNLPVRYEISNDGSGPASTLEHICTTVISEGGFDPKGKLHAVSTNGTHLNADADGTLYALIGIRLKSTHIGAQIFSQDISLLEETNPNGNFEWQLLLNPTVASTFTFAGVTNTAIERALGVTANTVTGGDLLAAGFVSGRSTITQSVENGVKLGRTIAGVMDRIVLCVRPLSANLDIQGAITIREV